jgi:predicted  nucleic acid-binding Zn-ribbon protein
MGKTKRGDSMIDDYQNEYETIMDNLRLEVTEAENLEADLRKKIRELEKALQNAVKALEEVEGTDDYYREEFRERVIIESKSALWAAIPVPEEEQDDN